MATGGASRGYGAKNKLIVNNLPQYFTEEEFESMFSNFGSVLSVRLCRSKTNNESLGYGFIEYVKPEDAAKAINDVDGLQLGNKKLRVAYSEPVGEDIKNSTKVIVYKLPGRFDEDSMEELFGKYGKLVKVRLLRDSVTNKTKYTGHVFFERLADAQRAVTNLEGFQPENSKNKLHLKIVDTDRPQGPSQPHTHHVHPYSVPRPFSQGGGRYQQIPSHVTAGKNCANVFLYNVGELVTEQEIYNLFSQFGGLQKIDIVRDPNTRVCKGYAFLTFDNRPSAENAIFTMDGMVYRGRQLQVRYKHG